jgi:chemotaxis protein MotA
MSISLPLGLAIGVSVIIWSILAEMKNPAIMGNIHGIVIVVGGTLAAAVICFPFSTFINMFRVFFRVLTGELKKESINVVNELIQLSVVVNKSPNSLPDSVSKVKNQFLKEAMELMLQDMLSIEELQDVLEKRVEIQHEKYRKENASIKLISKFPPAFGLIGATLGMIALLQGMGEPDAFEKLGPSMSVALTATFWGLVLANLFLLPIGENLMQAADDDLLIRRAVVEGVLLLKEKKHTLLVEEYLTSYVSPKDRSKLAKAT